jgi:hypothetical protein
MKAVPVRFRYVMNRSALPPRIYMMLLSKLLRVFNGRTSLDEIVLCVSSPHESHIAVIERRTGLSSGGEFAFGKIDDLMIKAVDNCCAGAVSHYGIKVSVGFVHVAMDKIPRLPFLEQRIEAFEPHVREIIHIPVSARGRMGKQDIETVHQHSADLRFTYPPPHFAFRVLVAPAVIPHAASESQNAETLIIVDSVFDANAAAGWFLFIPAVMVSPHIEEGTVGQRDQKFQISRGKVSGGQNKLHAAQTLRVIIVPQTF